MKLVIFMTDQRMRDTEQTVNPHVIDVTWEDPEVYGRGWAHMYKNDIVMLVEDDTKEFGRYLVFAYDMYYPGGGWTDFVDFVDTKEEFETLKTKQWYRDVWEIVDTKTWEETDWGK